ncbi:hypothetical protein PSMEN_08260 [Ectopseudomonas mendocina]|nr:hypothetical protein PSMEN_08260 [Pseudomonas mendocina]
MLKLGLHALGSRRITCDTGSPLRRRRIGDIEARLFRLLLVVDQATICEEVPRLLPCTTLGGCQHRLVQAEAGGLVGGLFHLIEKGCANGVHLFWR